MLKRWNFLKTGFYEGINLAFFGAPITHEDDPQRAVMSGLDIIEGIRPYREDVKRTWGIDFDVRVGINTGLVVDVEVGSDLHVEYTALGDAVNLAARMEQTAEPGTVQISGDTHRLIAPLFEFEDLGQIEVKGKSEPVQSYRVLGLKSDPGRLRGIEGLDSPLIGRDKELNALQGVIADLERGRGQILSVMGEAGLGKSRLIAELRKAAQSNGLAPATAAGTGDGAGRDSPGGISWHEARSISYETSTPYAPFVDLFGRYLDLRPDQEAADKYDRIKTRIGPFVSGDVEEVAPFVATMLGIEPTGDDLERVRHLQPPQVRDRVFRATRQLFEGLASARPMVLVFEDLHWADSTSLDLIDELMPLTDRAPLLMIGVFRPVRQEPSWRFHETAARDYSHRYTSLSLVPLDENDSRELVANLLHVEDLPERVRGLILTKAEGNPFFVEEVIRSLLDAQLVVREDSHWRATQEINDIAVPDTLAGVINARLDRLDDESKRVAQTASVIGREFDFDILSDVHEKGQGLEEALTDLQRRELVREKSLVPKRTYIFKHALTQETAYASLLLSTRRKLHKRVAECLEQIDPDRVHDIARHFLEAREQAQALPYLAEAGDRAARAYSTQDAIALYSQALEILESVTDLASARRAYEGLGGTLTFANDVPSAVENYHAMFHTAQEQDDVSMQVSALNKLGFVTALMQGQFPEAEQLARQSGDHAGLAELHVTYCYLRTSTGDFDDAMDHLTESAQIGRDLDLEEPKLFGLTHVANTLIYMTKFDEAWETAQEARLLAAEAGNKKWLSELMAFTIPMYHMRNGDLDTALQSAEAGLDLATQIGFTDNEFFGAFTKGQISWVKGEYEAAIESQERALAAGRASGMPFIQVAPLCALGTAYMNISEKLMDRTEQCHFEALELLEQPLGIIMGALAWEEVGFCLLAGGDPATAGELFQKGLTISTPMKYLLRPQLLIGSALVALSQGKPDEAAELVQQARAFAEERAMKSVYPFVAFADGHVTAANGQPERALEQFARAEELAREMLMRPIVWQAQAGAAQVLSAAGRTSEAGAKREAALAMIREIAALFKDDNLRSMFLESATSKLG